jgi:hypothetical protein
MNHKAKVKILDDNEELKIMGVKSSTWPTINPFVFVNSKHKMFTKVTQIADTKKWLNENFPNAITDFDGLIPGKVVW